MLKIGSPLPVVSHTIACCIAVHRALGPGLLETIYSRALAIEFAAACIPYEREKIFPVHYRGELLCRQHIDFVVRDTLVLEIKSIETFAPIHHSQLLNYMRIANVRVGLLVNFNVPVLKDGIKRKIL